MPTPLWELFVQRVTGQSRRQAAGEMNRLVGEIATQLACLDAPAAAEALSSLTERVAERYDEMRGGGAPGDPSDVGAPPGAPRPIPVPPDVLAAALRDFDEAEVLAGIREIRAGGGRKLEDFLPELQRLASQP